MVDKINPSSSSGANRPDNVKPIDPPKNKELEKDEEQKTQKLLGMNLTKKQYQQFLNTQVKEMLTLLKNGEKRLKNATKKIAHPEN